MEGAEPLPGDIACQRAADGLREAIETDPQVEARLDAIRTAEAEAEALAIANATIVDLSTAESGPARDAEADAIDRARRSPRTGRR